MHCDLPRFSLKAILSEHAGRPDFSNPGENPW
jgi:hypothetical protein